MPCIAAANTRKNAVADEQKNMNDESQEPAGAQSPAEGEQVAAEVENPAGEIEATAETASATDERQVPDDDLADIDDDDEDEEEYEGDVEPLELIEDAPEEEVPEMDWYILKVQSNREKSICDGLKRRVAVAGLDRYFADVIVPTEEVAEFKNGKKRVVRRKLYPGYIVVNMAINDDTWFLVRETPGIGDFTGSVGRPSPMLSHEVERILKAVRPQTDADEPVKTAIPFKSGDRVRIKDGTFENFEGEVEGIDEANGRVTVVINIFGRSTPTELEHWQIENL
jgi:transcriptional antiterminator NusG